VSTYTPSWPAVALGVACGVLFGALIALVLGPGSDEDRPLAAQTVTISRTVTVPGGATTTPGTVVTRTLVPDVMGERLDIAKRRLQARQFEVDVEGGGILGVIRERNWRVTEQRPAAGTYLEQGSSVLVTVEPVQHVAQDVDDLLGLACDRERRPVDLLERVVVALGMQDDERLAQRRRVAGVERRVPLAVLLAETHDDDIGALEQRAGADRIHPGAEVVVPERPLLLTQDRAADGVGRRVVGDRRAELDVQACLGGAALDALAPVGVDLATEVHVQGHGG
jgi:hypothetical protein